MWWAYVGGGGGGCELGGVDGGGGGVGWGTCGKGVRGLGVEGNFLAIFSKNQKPVACKKNWKELKRQKIRAKVEQK